MRQDEEFLPWPAMGPSPACSLPQQVGGLPIRPTPDGLEGAGPRLLTYTVDA